MKRNILLALLPAMCVTADPSAFAGDSDADFSAAIEGPESAMIGEPVKLQVQITAEQQSQEITSRQRPASIQFLWDLANPPTGHDIRDWIFDDGRTCVFATNQPGRYVFYVAGAAQHSGETPRLFLVRHALTIKRSEPPEPDLPGGRFGLAPAVFRLVSEHVPREQRRAAAPLAENYRSVAARISAGTLSDPSDILAETTEGNRQAVGEDRDAWLPFFEHLARRTEQLDEAGELKAADSLQEAWLEIATGLEAVGSE